MTTYEQELVTNVRLSWGKSSATNRLGVRRSEVSNTCLIKLLYKGQICSLLFQLVELQLCIISAVCAVRKPRL